LVQAQTFPTRTSETVNDFAGVLLPSEEVRLHDQLVALEEDTGVEMTVVTLTSLKEFSDTMSLEDYTTALFNTWGIGDASTNNGVLVLQVTDTRSVRLELGDGYQSGWDGAAKRVLERSFIPAFKDGNFGPGMLAGVDDTIISIIEPHLAGIKPPSDGLGAWWVALIALPFAGIFGMRHLSKRLRKCPQCEKRGTLTVKRKNIRAASETEDGEDQEDIHCSNCTYRTQNVIAVPLSGPDNHSSSGGGGSSSGGGASGNY
jgi:uncharacterized protein